MIPRPRPERFRLRRTMMFMNAQKPGLIKDAYIYGVDSIMLDLEDAVAENQKDAARFSLYHALKTIDYGDTEVIVRINGLDTPHWQEDIRVSVAGGADGVRIPTCESAEDVKKVEEHVLAAEKEFGVEEGRTLIMAALESPKGVLNAYEIASASDRLFGIALSAGDFHRSMHTHYVPGGIELNTARNLIVMSARAAGVQCFDTVFTNLDDEEGFENEVRMIHDMALMARASSIRARLPLCIRRSLRRRRKSPRLRRMYARMRSSRSSASASTRSTARWSISLSSRMPAVSSRWRRLAVSITAIYKEEQK